MAGLVVVAALLAPPLSAQRYLVQTYAEQDGLRSSTVEALAQDGRGRLWFLTRAGVLRFDGFEWLTQGDCTGQDLWGYELLTPDGAAGIWLGGSTPGRPLLHFDASCALREKLRAPGAEASGVDRDAQQRTRLASVPLPSGRLLALGTRGAGLHLGRDGDWTTLDAADGLPGGAVLALEGAGGRLFVGTESGLALLEDGRLQPEWAGLLPADFGAVRALAWDDAAEGGALWVVGGERVGRIQNDRFRTAASGVPIPFHPGTDLLVAEPDGEGGLFFGSQVQLFHLEGDDARVYPLGRREGLAAEGATDLLRDREGSIWVSTPRGVSRIGSLRFAAFDAGQGLLEDEVTALAETPDGALVLGHNDGLSIVRDGVVTATHTLDRSRFPELDGSGPLPTRVLDLDVDHRGTIWAALGHLGVARVGPSGAVERYGGGPALTDRIDTVREDASGSILLGTPGGLVRLTDGEPDPVAVPGLREVFIRRMVRGSDDSLYLATGGDGLHHRRGGTWRRAGSGPDPRHDDLFTVLEDRAGRVWVGSAAGLLVLDGDRLRWPDAPRVEQAVYSLVEDPEGTLWVGTAYGLYRWDGDALDHFTARDGLPGNEANRAAALVDRGGKLWIGTDRGLTLVRDRGPRVPASPPPVEVIEVLVDGERFPPGVPREVGYHRNRLTFRVGAVSFQDAEALEYRTRLEGHEDTWRSERGPARIEARYSALPAGAYTFHAQARSPGGAWSPTVSSAAVTIARPFWLQGWFLGLAGLAVAGLVYSGHRFAVQRRYAHRLEEEVASRTAELAASRSRIEADRERLARTVESVADGIAAIDSGGRVTLWNPAAEELTGWPARDAAGRALREVLPVVGERGQSPDDGDAPGDDVLSWLLDPENRPSTSRHPRTFTLRDRRGGHKTVELTAAPTGGPRTPAGRGAVLAFRDVTERRRFEAELARVQKLESLGVLAGGIAHDFNNLLTVVIGYLSLLRATAGLDERADECLDHAEQALSRAQELSGRLLTFSQGGAPVTGPVSVDRLLRESADFATRGSPVRCSCELPPGLWAAQADESQISQVVGNLLLNAVQAMPGGGVVILRAENLEIGAGEIPSLAPGRYVHLQVQDRGPGIEPEVLPRIFDPFFTTKDSGTGLGLTTAYSIVRQHGGAITVDSRREKPFAGTRFDLYLPAACDRAAPRAVARAQETKGSRRILVMEDEAQVRGALQGMLRHLGYDVVATADGDEAVRRYSEALSAGEPFDVAILDLTVPGGKGGKATLQELAALDPDVLAVVSSGYSDDPAIANRSLEGFAASLPKPYDLDGLGRVLQRVLEGGEGPPSRRADRTSGPDPTAEEL